MNLKYKEFLNDLPYIIIGISLPCIIFTKNIVCISIIIGFICKLPYLDKASFYDTIKKFKNHTITKIFVLFIIVCFASSLISEQPFYSIKNSINFVLAFFIVFCTYMIFDNASSKKKKKMTRFLFYAFSFCIFFVILDMFLIPPEIHKFIYGNSSLLEHQIRYSVNFLSVPFPLILGFLYSNKKTRKFSIFFALFSLFVFISSGGRASILACTVNMFTILFMLFYFKYEKINFKNVIFLLFSLFLAFSSGSLVYKKFSPQHFERRFTLKSEDLSSTRFKIWDFTLQKALEKPLLGHGAKSFRYLSQENKRQEIKKAYSPHNFILEVFFSTGIIGLIIFSIFGLFSFCYLLKLVSSYGIIVIFTVSNYISFWVSSLTIGSIFSVSWITLFTTTILFGVFYSKSIIKNNTIEK
ncbi:MAG: O-antigen ligase family protein [Proteobacteria bacterium]|nr:O-antigen ligase family protein [Pseudomonadota bacterium]